MEAIYIPQLLAKQGRKEEILVEEFLPGLDTLTPVRGVILVNHCNNYLKVSVQAETIVTLSCDRCLQQYNHKLSLDVSELIWLEEEVESIDLPNQEREIQLEDLSETLSPQGYFCPDSWLYEQLSLAMPIRQLCGKNCISPSFTSEISESELDQRWSSLESLKQKFDR